MFDFLSSLPETHAIALLKKDHDRVKQLFDDFEKAKGRGEKDKIIAEAVTELKIHALLEEELFYPAVRSHVGAEQMSEADEEHHVAKVLIAELDAGRSDLDHRNAKFRVLAESVRHHIKEEENEVLPKARSMKIDFEALGARMLERKQQLLADGIPNDAEHLMVDNAAGRTDSPASAARRKAKKASKSAVAARRKTKKPASKATASRKTAASVGTGRSQAKAAGRRSR